MDALTTAAMTIEELRAEYRAKRPSCNICGWKIGSSHTWPCNTCANWIVNAITADLIATRDTLLQVQEAYAALERKLADVEQANRVARDLYEQARVEALVASYREKAAQNRTRILAERVDLLEAQLEARADAAQQLQRTIAAMEKSNV